MSSEADASRHPSHQHHVGGAAAKCSGEDLAPRTPAFSFLSPPLSAAGPAASSAHHAPANGWHESNGGDGRSGGGADVHRSGASGGDRRCTGSAPPPPPPRRQFSALVERLLDGDDAPQQAGADGVPAAEAPSALPLPSVEHAPQPSPAALGSAPPGAARPQSEIPPPATPPVGLTVWQSLVNHRSTPMESLSRSGAWSDCAWLASSASGAGTGTGTGSGAGASSSAGAGAGAGAGVRCGGKCGDDLSGGIASHSPSAASATDALQSARRPHHHQSDLRDFSSLGALQLDLRRIAEEQRNELRRIALESQTHPRPPSSVVPAAPSAAISDAPMDAAGVPPARWREIAWEQQTGPASNRSLFDPPPAQAAAPPPVSTALRLP